jgi:hypothetical protein
MFHLINRKYFKIEFFGAFYTKPDSSKDIGISLIKRFAIRLNLMPKTMRGKEFLKRIFFGKLFDIPSEIREGLTRYIPPVPLPADKSSSIYKVIYAVAEK